MNVKLKNCQKFFDFPWKRRCDCNLNLSEAQISWKRSKIDGKCPIFRENSDLAAVKTFCDVLRVEIKLEEAWNREIFDQNSSVNLILLELRKTDWIFREIVKNRCNLDSKDDNLRLEMVRDDLEMSLKLNESLFSRLKLKFRVKMLEVRLQS